MKEKKVSSAKLWALPKVARLLNLGLRKAPQEGTMLSWVKAALLLLELFTCSDDGS